VLVTNSLSVFPVVCADLPSRWFVHKTRLLVAACYFQANRSGW